MRRKKWCNKWSKKYKHWHFSFNKTLRFIRLATGITLKRKRSVAFRILWSSAWEGGKASLYAEMFCIITCSHYVRHYWACSELSSSPSGGVVISSQSRFSLCVPPKESMLQHIRKSPRLIKPLIFCDAGALLNTIYRDGSARRRTQCVFYGESLLIRRKMILSCGYGHCLVCGCVSVWSCAISVFTGNCVTESESASM